MNKDTLQYLLERREEGKLSTWEQQLLDNWEAALEKEEGAFDLYSEAEQTELKDRLWDNISKQTSEPGKLVSISVPKQPARLKRTTLFKYAASIILVAGVAAYIWSADRSPKKQIVSTVPAAVARDVAAPSSNHATITLAGGQRITLETAANGTLAIQGDVNIRKMDDGRIVYTGNSNGEVQYNTLTVPRGSTIASIVLSDGTKVYLNAASSLTYPVAFNGNERRVQITGEAYFEVAKDRSKKFIVTSGAVTTEVLGTHFNINTYPDEEAMKVTLLEGSVKVSGGSSNTVIKPGDQAAIENGQMHINQAVDVDQVMSWKNGVFNFNNASCETVMRQLARWYNIEIVYPKGVPAIQFGGEIQKTLPLAEMLDALGEVEVKFEINNKKLIVLP